MTWSKSVYSASKKLKTLILDRLSQKTKTECIPKRYSPDLGTFAITVHYYSPRPKTKTRSSWYKSVKGEPGLLMEAIETISECVKLMFPHNLLLALILDAIAIREHIELMGTDYYGFVNLGPNIWCRERVPAKEAVVFMIVCINDVWKIPIAYFLVNGLSAELKRNLIVQVLVAVNKTGAKVVSLICDGPSTNISVLKLLGSCLDNPQNLQTFPHPVTGENIVAFLDSPHMLKLVRNTFGALKVIQMLHMEQYVKVFWNHI